MLNKPQENSHLRNTSMEAQYNAKQRSFQPGDLIYAKHFDRNKSYWVPGKILDKVGNVVYNTLIKVGNRTIKVRSHTDQLRLRIVADQPDNETEMPLDILLKEFDITATTPSDCFHTPPSTPWSSATHHYTKKRSRSYRKNASSIILTGEMLGHP